MCYLPVVANRMNPSRTGDQVSPGSVVLGGGVHGHVEELLRVVESCVGCC